MGIFELPEGYTEIKRVDLQKNIKLAVLVNVLALVIAVVVFFIGTLVNPFSFSIDYENLTGTLLTLGGVFFAMILYLVAHELIHGVFMKKYSGKKARYGFTGLYAYAGSDAYFAKGAYLVIGLAPVVTFFALCLLLNTVLPEKWFWPVYFIQIINLSGAAGDLYVTCLMSRMPANTLVKDDGTAMSIYTME